MRSFNLTLVVVMIFNCQLSSNVLNGIPVTCWGRKEGEKSKKETHHSDL